MEKWNPNWRTSRCPTAVADVEGYSGSGAITQLGKACGGAWQGHKSSGANLEVHWEGHQEQWLCIWP